MAFLISSRSFWQVLETFSIPSFAKNPAPSANRRGLYCKKTRSGKKINPVPTEGTNEKKILVAGAKPFTPLLSYPLLKLVVTFFYCTLLHVLYSPPPSTHSKGINEVEYIGEW
jgi:hypothetical protein